MQANSQVGASLRLNAVETLSSETASQRVREQLFDVLACGLPVSVTVEGVGEALFAEAVFAKLCVLLGSALEDARAESAKLSIAIDATLMLPQQLWMKRCELLGPGPLYLLLGSSLTPPSADANTRRQQDKFWLQCWHLRHCQYVRLALAPSISSPCPLLASENAVGILPPLGLQVPPGSAWVPMQIDLCDFASASGVIDRHALCDALQRCIDFGERTHDRMNWPTAAMRHDAWLNRRLAITINGIGELAKLRHLDPQRFGTLQNLGDVLQDVREIVNSYSRQLASQTEPAPSLDLSDACHGPAWQARWREALQFAAMRHRNLLAMSPWAVFPAADTTDVRYCDLLPLLEYADVCEFSRAPNIQSWNINKFKHFHHRAWATLERRDARNLFAERI